MQIFAMRRPENAEHRTSSHAAQQRWPGCQLYGWKGTCLGGRPGPEIGNFGKLKAGFTIGALAGA